MELVCYLDADDVLNYNTPEDAILMSSASGEKYDYIINFAINIGWSLMRPTLTSHGRVVEITPNPGNYIQGGPTMTQRYSDIY
jgi:hypothetical protein